MGKKYVYLFFCRNFAYFEKPFLAMVKSDYYECEIWHYCEIIAVLFPLTMGYKKITKKASNCC